METSGVYRALSSFGGSKWRLTCKSALVGAIAGVLVSLYRVGIEFGAETAFAAYGFLRAHPAYIALWLPLGALVAWAAYRLIALEPYAKGSGIPQVEGIVLLGMKIRWHTVLAVRFAAGLLTSFFGLSVGREGPSIQIGAAGAQAFCHRGEKNKAERNYLITAGAAAGLSAAFNAPLSGIVFTLEEVHRSFSPRILVAATSAALVADLVSSFFFGLTPVLGFLSVPVFPLRLYPWLILVGVVSGLTGALINRLLLASGPAYDRLPAPLRIGAALLFALPCGLL
ncbi:MAG: ClC family H(+)/Cl(-) exchange transporter, partial [Clostridiales bacterium]|nr:ClC family H(+)/Cl(-) exchange transporter [Clostridiales bacterium]